MTVAITDYSDTDKIRAALGVDEADVDDQTMVDMQLVTEVEVDLLSWLPAYEDIDDTLSVKLLQLYVTAFCAFTALDGRELLYPFLFKDGKAETRRFNLDLQQLKVDLAARAAKWKAALLRNEGLEAVPVGTASYIFGSAQPDYDPVTGA